MIEQQVIDGRPAHVAYFDDDMQPADKEEWTLAKVIFDNGEVVWVTNKEAEAEEQPVPPEAA